MRSSNTVLGSSPFFDVTAEMKLRSSCGEVPRLTRTLVSLAPAHYAPTTLPSNSACGRNPRYFAISEGCPRGLPISAAHLSRRCLFCLRSSKVASIGCFLFHIDSKYELSYLYVFVREVCSTKYSPETSSHGPLSKTNFPLRIPILVMRT